MSGSNAGNVWVSVKDRLPKKTHEANEADKWVLCCTEFGSCLLSLCYYDHNTKKWYDAFNPHHEERITHWMPLPAPPNKDETPIKSNDDKKYQATLFLENEKFVFNDMTEHSAYLFNCC